MAYYLYPAETRISVVQTAKRVSVGELVKLCAHLRPAVFSTRPTYRQPASTKVSLAPPPPLYLTLRAPCDSIPRIAGGRAPQSLQGYCRQWTGPLLSAQGGHRGCLQVIQTTAYRIPSTYFCMWMLKATWVHYENRGHILFFRAIWNYCRYHEIWARTSRTSSTSTLLLGGWRGGIGAVAAPCFHRILACGEVDVSTTLLLLCRLCLSSV